jgi:hypothetical protein
MPPPLPPQQEAPEWGAQSAPADVVVAINLHCGAGFVPASRTTVDDLVASIVACRGPDVSDTIRTLVARIKALPMTDDTEVADKLFTWGGGSDLGLSAHWDILPIQPNTIRVNLVGVFDPADMREENDDRLHRLKREGQSCSYAQCDDVVLLGPGDGDPRYAVLRYACMLSTGTPLGESEGTITRRDHRMGRDSLDVEAIVADYKASFEAAMEPITDKSIDWVDAS